jgi:hypothetical protein
MPVDQLPSGTVTFPMADIEGSTRLWEAHGVSMGAVLARHEQLVADVVATCGAYRPVEQGEGDSAVAVFRRAYDAIEAATTLQRRLTAEAWPDGVAPWFRYVDLGTLDATSNAELVDDTLSCLDHARPMDQFDTPRVLDVDTYRQAYDAWTIARDDIVASWNRLADPSNLQPTVPAAILLFPLDGRDAIEAVCSRAVLYQLTQRKMARRASARVANTRPWTHSRLSDSQNDSATALSTPRCGRRRGVAGGIDSTRGSRWRCTAGHGRRGR